MSPFWYLLGVVGVSLPPTLTTEEGDGEGGSRED